MSIPTESLLKYDNAERVSIITKEKSQKPAISGAVPPPPKAKSSLSDTIKEQTQEILNAILPPRQWTENNQLWVQQVSSMPCTKTEVIHLQEDLDLKLEQGQARDTGICPVRRELYTQCFDELLRQVTINCGERGLLLLQVRDEIRMTMAAYQTLYESSVAFGMRRALQAEQEKSDMEKKIADLETDKTELERQVNEQKSKCEAIETRESERRQVDEATHIEEISFLKSTNQQLKAQLEAIITPRK